MNSASVSEQPITPPKLSGEARVGRRRPRLAAAEEGRVRVDVHAHYFAPAYLEVVERAYAQPLPPREVGVRKIIDGKVRPNPAMYELDERLALMDRAGVDLQVLSVSIPMTYHPDRETAVAMAQASNDGCADACRQHPTRFKAFASLPLPHVDAALAELTRAIDVLGLHGV